VRTVIELSLRTIGQCALLAILIGCAQRIAPFGGTPASLRGVVQDESGRRVTHALVELTSLADRNAFYADTTDEQGRFLLSGLAPGTYRVRVARVGSRQLIWERVIAPSSADSLLLTLLGSDRGLLVCTPTPPAGLQLVLRDAQTGHFITDSVLAVARAEEYADTLRRRSLPTRLRVPVYHGIHARAGTYSVSVHRSGYEDVHFPVLLAPSSCGVTPVLLEVFLVPQ
jgi:hypothetical protein